MAENQNLLVEYVTNKSEEAFNGLVKAYAPLVFSVCKRVLNKQDLVEDAVQATFLKFSQKASTLVSEKVISSWLYKTAWHISIWMKRQDENQVKKEFSMNEKNSTPLTPEEEMSWQETKIELDRAICGLPEKYRAAIVAYYLDGTDYKELKKIFNCEEATIRKRVSRGLEKLKEILKGKGVGVSSVMLATFLSTRIVEAVPAILVPKLTAGVVLSVGAASAGKSTLILKGINSMIFWMKVRVGTAVLTASLILIGILVSQDNLVTGGEIGKVTDQIGGVYFKPVNELRWNFAEENSLIEPGDLLKTESRGANILEVQMKDKGFLTLGPGTIVEVKSETEFILSAGEIFINPKNSIKVRALKGIINVKKPSVIHLVDNIPVILKKEPGWLAQFQGDQTKSSLGSLVVNIDGRSTSLTIGDHLVSVDIRDQIARTTIVETFKNHTHSQMEGVFYFPLPQGASISSFAMWIGDEMVEGDIVEKQRAREIYETILREDRDPGLLEWTGGNVFKARVFPIFAMSEKKIKISYTQVLPRFGSEYHYHYPLQSEMLKKNPLKNLAIKVNVFSDVPLEKVECKSHTTRTVLAENSASVEYHAQEITPEEDFELKIRVESGSEEITFIPHKRDQDGYFLLLFSPSKIKDELKRKYLSNNKPLEVMLVLDTSGSIGDQQRKAQEKLVQSFLSQLSSKDSFNLCTVDNEIIFLSPVFQKIGVDAIPTALKFLEARQSMGWSDLDLLGEKLLEKVSDSTQIIYMGDGTPTANEADAVILLSRQSNTWKNAKATWHTISTSSHFEPMVMNGLTKLAKGNGSYKQTSKYLSPSKLVSVLLKEILEPGLINIRLKISGIRTASIYPKELSKLSVGSQQVIAGRYLPGGKRAVVVEFSGLQNGKEVSFTKKIALDKTAKANSYIPRLWARKHLDFLLEQGRENTIKDTIIALSEEFQIITPYTSFLVLESDEDRERFKVKRQFRMAGGEQFFAEAKQKIDFQLAQKQSLLAKKWRQNLHKHFLRELEGFQVLSYQGSYGVLSRVAIIGSLFSSSMRPTLEIIAGNSTTVQMDFDGKLAESHGFRSELLVDEIVNDHNEAESYFLENEERLFPVALPIVAKEVRSGVYKYKEGREWGRHSRYSRHTSISGWFPLSNKNKISNQESGSMDMPWWLNNLFSDLPLPHLIQEREIKWSESDRTLADTIGIFKELKNLKDGLEVYSYQQSIGVNGSITNRLGGHLLFEHGRWINKNHSDHGNHTSWATPLEIGSISEFGFGRLKKINNSKKDFKPTFFWNGIINDLKNSWYYYHPKFQRS